MAQERERATREFCDLDSRSVGETRFLSELGQVSFVPRSEGQLLGLHSGLTNNGALPPSGEADQIVDSCRTRLAKGCLSAWELAKLM